MRSDTGQRGVFSDESSFRVLSRSLASESFKAQRDQPSMTSPISPIADIGTIQVDYCCVELFSKHLFRI